MTAPGTMAAPLAALLAPAAAATVLALAWRGRPRRPRRLPPPVASAGLATGARCGVPTRRRARRRVLDAQRRALPELVDLVHLALAAGLNIPLTIVEVAPRAPPPFADAMASAAGEIAAGARAGDALGALPHQSSEVVRPLVDALVGADRYGVAVLPAIERVADDARLDRARAAEAAARRVPVKLLFPLVVCVLPAFALLTVTPLLAGTLRSLRL